jgi:hypothetical protein
MSRPGIARSRTRRALDCPFKLRAIKYSKQIACCHLKSLRFLTHTSHVLSTWFPRSYLTRTGFSPGVFRMSTLNSAAMRAAVQRAEVDATRKAAIDARVAAKREEKRRELEEEQRKMHKLKIERLAKEVGSGSHFGISFFSLQDGLPSLAGPASRVRFAGRISQRRSMASPQRERPGDDRGEARAAGPSRAGRGAVFAGRSLPSFHFL